MTGVKLEEGWIILWSLVVSVGMQAAAVTIYQPSYSPLLNGDFQGAAHSSNICRMGIIAPPGCRDGLLIL